MGFNIPDRFLCKNSYDGNYNNRNNLLDKGAEMWVSECCGSEPDYKFSVYGEDVGMPSGICSECEEHCDLKYSDDD